MDNWIDPEIQNLVQKLAEKNIVLTSCCAGFGVSRWTSPSRLKKVFQSKGIIKEEREGILLLEAEKHPINLSPFIEVNVEKSDIRKICRITEFLSTYRVHLDSDSAVITISQQAEDNKTIFKFYNVEFKHFSQLEHEATIATMHISYPKRLSDHEHLSKSQIIELRKSWISYFEQAIQILE